MKTKITAVALAAFTMLALAAIPAQATHPEPCDVQSLRVNECPVPEEPASPCDLITDQVRIGLRDPGDPRRVIVHLDATNTNQETNGNALEADLVLTYQANRTNSQPQTIFADAIDDGGDNPLSLTFSVPNFRFTDGRVWVGIEDVGCDGVNETVDLTK